MIIVVRLKHRPHSIFLFIAPKSLTEDATEYIRFSTASFERIQDKLNISSSNLTLAIFESALLEAIGTNLQGQQIVRCELVTR